MPYVKSCVRIVLLGLSVVALGSSQASAVPIAGPEYPAPGSNVWSGSGSTGRDQTGTLGFKGANWSYSGFDLGATQDLWWGLWSGAPLQLAMDGNANSPGENLTLSSFSATTAVWTGSSSFSYNCNPCSTSVLNTRFTITLSGNASFIDANDLLTIDPSFDATIGVVAEITGDYTANLLHEAEFGTGNWVPVLDLFDGEQTNPAHSVVRESSFGFYSTVPEPGTAALLAVGLVVLGTRSRRR